MLDVQTGGTQSRKRPRADSDTHANSRQDNATDSGDLLPVKCEDLKHHEELWFEDGSVILVAGNVGFRVYAGILSRDSVVFRNLLNAPGAKSEVMENCPVLRVQDTSADLEVFLSFVYSGSKFVSNAKRLPFSTISSLVRLGHKYEVYRLRDDGLARLKTCYPSEYTDENWNDFAKLNSSVMVMENTRSAISVVNLARLTQMDILLPMALYACTYLHLSTLLHGFHCADGVLETLSPEDLFRCLQGMKNLLKAKRKASVWILKLRHCSTDCQTPKKCCAAISSLLRRAHDAGSLASFQALNPLLQPDDEYFCKWCEDMIISQDDVAIRRIFAKLPSYMGVTVEDWATASGKPNFSLLYLVNFLNFL
ncbi:hypothetical protein B0H21DRAFT_698423 [Amylocystis lapponica]|nr:hypothetical protein B0H21DRAFT_698423 [Amylocystis lapponica]